MTIKSCTGIKIKRIKYYFTFPLTSRAWFVLWKAHVYVTEAFLVMLCVYDCLPLLPSQDSTTVVLFLFTSCRGRHRTTIKTKSTSWIPEQQHVQHCDLCDTTLQFWLAGEISHLITMFCWHVIKHAPSWSRAHSRQSRWSQTQRLSGQTR